MRPYKVVHYHLKGLELDFGHFWFGSYDDFDTLERWEIHKKQNVKHLSPQALEQLDWFIENFDEILAVYKMEKLKVAL